MAFLNSLGTVSRGGQWRFRRIFRSAYADGRLDQSDAGLIDFRRASLVVLTVTPRPPFDRGRCWDGAVDGCDGPAPVLTASTADRSLLIVSPGLVEALFPASVMSRVRPGLYDVRLVLTIGPETAEIMAEPVEIR